MKLNDSKMNEIFKNSSSLGDFLLECANLILMRIGGCVSIDELPDNIIITLVDWWKKMEQSQKYTVQIAPGAVSCLNVHWNPIDICVSDSESTGYWQAVFNRQEIEELKKRDDVVIDWDKAIINPVEE